MTKQKGSGSKPPKNDQDDWELGTHDTIVTQHTKTQALDDEAQKDLERDVASAKSADPILVTIRGNAQGKKHSIPMGSIALGRSRECQIRILDPSVSGRHALLHRKSDGEIEIEDLGSNNGTFVNNERIHGKVILHKEDMSTVGTTILKYVPAGELEILYHGNLIKAAYIDRLTGIYNQNYITEALEAEFKRAKALAAKFSVILIDVDQFKQINDQFGHNAGDFALREFASIVTSQILRPTETMGRYGGDEFIILLWNVAARETGGLAERIRKLVETTEFLFEGQRLPMTLSLGIAQARPDHKNVKNFIADADSALYESKKKGRNASSVFTP
jgi:two-component system cell cycle response regulator